MVFMSLKLFGNKISTTATKNFFVNLPSKYYFEQFAIFLLKTKLNYTILLDSEIFLKNDVCLPVSTFFQILHFTFAQVAIHIKNVCLRNDFPHLYFFMTSTDSLQIKQKGLSL